MSGTLGHGILLGIMKVETLVGQKLWQWSSLLRYFSKEDSPMPLFLLEEITKALLAHMVMGMVKTFISIWLSDELKSLEHLQMFYI
jgi:hypothetical protein